MKKSLLCLAVIGLLFVITGPAYAYFAFTTNDLHYLNHNAAYTWGIDWSVPEGDQVTSATLIFSNLNNIDEPEDDAMYVHLLDNPRLGVRAFADLVREGDDFAGQGVHLTTFTDDNGYYFMGRYINPAEDFVYSFNADQLSALESYLGDGSFGFGIDPDCAYQNNGVKFVVGTRLSPVPEPATMSLLGMGVLGLLGLKRKKA